MLFDYMNRKKNPMIGILMLLVMLLLTGSAFGHCDSEDGPIIPEIQTALDNGDVVPLLKWLPPEHEAEISDLFQRVTALRNISEDARELADQLFIETFIRLHRAGEGAPFTGIKTAGSMPPIFSQLDKALDEDSIDKLANQVAETVRDGITTRFQEASDLRKQQNQSVAAGRKYVEAYITYMHFVEGLHNYISNASADHNSVQNKGHNH